MKMFNERPVAFPNVKSFNELFDSVAPRKPGTDGPLISLQGNDNVVTGSVHVSGAANTRVSFYYFAARPKQIVLDYLAANTVPIGDRLYFKIWVYTDGTAMIQASYNKILGSRILAVVSRRTIPTEKSLNR